MRDSQRSLDGVSLMQMLPVPPQENKTWCRAWQLSDGVGGLHESPV